MDFARGDFLFHNGHHFSNQPACGLERVGLIVAHILALRTEQAAAWRVYLGLICSGTAVIPGAQFRRAEI
jgi:hypothetical protein